MLLLLTDPLDPPTDLHETGRSVIGPHNCCHEVGWSVPDRRGLKEYILMRITDETVIEKHRIHPEENQTIYNKGLKDNVTLVIVAVNHCDVESNMSNHLILCKLHIYSTQYKTQHVQY